MKRDRERGKRNNWLLIKHRDKFAREGGDALLRKDRSVASGRRMADIAAGRGAKPRAVHSDRTAAQAPRREGHTRAGDQRPADRRHVAAAAVRRAAAGTARHACATAAPGWGHEIKFDGYRMQMRVVDGKAALRTRKGLDWTERFPEIAQIGRKLPDCLIDGEIVALDERGVPSFSALQAALVEEDTSELVYLHLRSAACRRQRLPQPSHLKRARSACRHCCRRRRWRRACATSSISRQRPMPSSKSACRMSLEGVVSKRLDAPYRSGRGDTWPKTKCRAGHEVVIGGWTVREGQLRSLLAGVHRGGRLSYVGPDRHGLRPERRPRVSPGRCARSRARPALSPAPTRRRERPSPLGPPELVAEIAFAGWTGSRQWCARPPSRDCAKTRRPTR